MSIRITTKLLTFLAVVLPSSTARADVALDAARACFVEGGWSATECDAVLGVIRRRATVFSQPFALVLWSYSAIKGDSPRARLARSLPASDDLRFSQRENLAWAELRAAAVDFLAGLRSSPCPTAMHYGAPNLDGDVMRAARAVLEGRWQIARCRVATRNIYYAISRRVRPLTAAQPLPPRLLTAAVARGFYPGRTRQDPQ